LSKLPGAPPCSLGANCSRYEGSASEHEAGYDAYLTGCCFAILRSLGHAPPDTAGRMHLNNSAFALKLHDFDGDARAEPDACILHLQQAPPSAAAPPAAHAPSAQPVRTRDVLAALQPLKARVRVRWFSSGDPAPAAATSGERTTGSSAGAPPPSRPIEDSAFVWLTPLPATTMTTTATATTATATATTPNASTSTPALSPPPSDTPEVGAIISASSALALLQPLAVSACTLEDWLDARARQEAAQQRAAQQRAAAGDEDGFEAQAGAPSEVQGTAGQAMETEENASKRDGGAGKERGGAKGKKRPRDEGTKDDVGGSQASAAGAAADEAPPVRRTRSGKRLAE
jgi:hypothetical protein